MPNEPPGSRVRETIRARAYPLREWAGILWAYLGPADRMPELPQLEWALLPDEQRQVIRYEQQCNWVQALEGDIDSSHASFLHAKLDPTGFRVGYDTQSLKYMLGDRHPRIEPVETEVGLMIGARRDAEPDSYYWRVTHWLAPYYTLVGNDVEGRLGFGEIYVPVDDSRTMVWCPRWSVRGPLTTEERRRNVEGPDAAVATLDPATGRLRAALSNRFFQDRETQRKVSFSGIPGIREQDTAVVEGMGAIVDRSEEHLVLSDAAIVAMRRMLLARARALKEGREPPAAARPELYRVRAWAAVLPRSIGSFTDDPQIELRRSTAGAVIAALAGA